MGQIPREVSKFLKKCGVPYELVKTKDHYIIHINGERVTIGNNSSKSKDARIKFALHSLRKIMEG